MVRLMMPVIMSNASILEEFDSNRSLIPRAYMTVWLHVSLRAQRGGYVSPPVPRRSVNGPGNCGQRLADAPERAEINRRDVSAVDKALQ